MEVNSGAPAGHVSLRTVMACCNLRPWHPTDKPSLLLHGNNRNVWRNLSDMFPHPYTEADADYWLSVANQAAPSIHYAVEFEGEAVGGIGVIAGEGIARFTGQFGYWLGEAHWGKGIATAAARTMVSHVFKTTQLERLEASVYEWNPSSMRVLEKVDFVREGVLRRSVYKDGQVIDRVIYAHFRGN